MEKASIHVLDMIPIGNLEGIAVVDENELIDNIISIPKLEKWAIKLLSRGDVHLFMTILGSWYMNLHAQYICRYLLP